MATDKSTYFSDFYVVLNYSGTYFMIYFDITVTFVLVISGCISLKRVENEEAVGTIVK